MSAQVKSLFCPKCKMEYLFSTNYTRVPHTCRYCEDVTLVDGDTLYNFHAHEAVFAGALQAIEHPDEGDQLILHALGVSSEK